MKGKYIMSEIGKVDGSNNLPQNELKKVVIEQDEELISFQEETVDDGLTGDTIVLGATEKNVDETQLAQDVNLSDEEERNQIERDKEHEGQFYVPDADNPHYEDYTPTENTPIDEEQIIIAGAEKDQNTDETQREQDVNLSDEEEAKQRERDKEHEGEIIIAGAEKDQNTDETQREQDVNLSDDEERNQIERDKEHEGEIIIAGAEKDQNTDETQREQDVNLSDEEEAKQRERDKEHEGEIIIAGAEKPDNKTSETSIYQDYNKKWETLTQKYADEAKEQGLSGIEAKIYVQKHRSSEMPSLSEMLQETKNEKQKKETPVSSEKPITVKPEQKPDETYVTMPAAHETEPQTKPEPVSTPEVGKESEKSEKTGQASQNEPIKTVPSEKTEQPSPTENKSNEVKPPQTQPQQEKTEWKSQYADKMAQLAEGKSFEEVFGDELDNVREYVTDEGTRSEAYHKHITLKNGTVIKDETENWVDGSYHVIKPNGFINNYNHKGEYTGPEINFDSFKNIDRVEFNKFFREQAIVDRKQLIATPKETQILTEKLEKAGVTCEDTLDVIKQKLKDYEAKNKQN